MRQHLEPRQEPKLGLYKSNDPEVITEHISQSVRAEIDFWAVSWWGPGDFKDRTFLNDILKHHDAANSNMRFFTKPPGESAGEIMTIY